MLWVHHFEYLNQSKPTKFATMFSCKVLIRESHSNFWNGYHWKNSYTSWLIILNIWIFGKNRGEWTNWLPKPVFISFFPRRTLAKFDIRYLIPYMCGIAAYFHLTVIIGSSFQEQLNCCTFFSKIFYFW